MWSQLWEEHCYTPLPWLPMMHSPEPTTEPTVIITSVSTTTIAAPSPPPAKPSPNSSSSNHLPRELMNLLPPPVSKCEQLLLKEKQEKESESNMMMIESIKKRTYRERSESQEHLNLLLCMTNGFDREDLHFLKRTWDAMREGDGKGETLDEFGPAIKMLKWVDHPETKRSQGQTAARIRDYSKKEDRTRAVTAGVANITNKGMFIPNCNFIFFDKFEKIFWFNS